MPMPTKEQQTQAIADQAAAVGAVNVRVHDVALSLDARFSGMTDEEFSELRRMLQPEVEKIRQDGLRALWE